MNVMLDDYNDTNREAIIKTNLIDDTDLDNTINNEWWKEFEDNDLDSLIALFLNNNYNLKLAYQALQSSLYKSKINGDRNYKLRYIFAP